MGLRSVVISFTNPILGRSRRMTSTVRDIKRSEPPGGPGYPTMAPGTCWHVAPSGAMRGAPSGAMVSHLGRD